ALAYPHRLRSVSPWIFPRACQVKAKTIRARGERLDLDQDASEPHEYFLSTIGEGSSVIRWQRPLVAVVIAVSTIVIANIYRADRRPLQPVNPTDVTLVYVGAQDCAPCRSWRRGVGE